MKKSKFYYATVAILIAGFAFISNRVQAGGEKFYSDLIRLDKVVTKINENYVEDVSSEELVDAAIGGIRSILDPHTAYFTPKDYEDLKVNTEGEFGGLGIQIGIRDQILTVVSPLAGTPAHRMGLQAGDKIIRIDTISTQGISIDDAVEKLRGKPGSPVKIQILREGMLEPMEFNIVREVIKIESVPYGAMINDSVGYIKITQFAKRTSEDLEARINELKKKDMKSLIIDLRVNPGGLLNQAISVSELFLDKNQMVVYTKGRVKSQNQEYHSRRNPIWTKKMVVLVNENSASASEIVAGAIQDWDRGIVLGETSFGKGSVQTILPLDGQQNTLKLTTAYYYTPAGRCINKPENAVRFKLKAAANDSTKKDTAFFYTKAGRKVLAGGGITPDVILPGRKYTRFSTELLRKTMFFNYVIKKRFEINKKTKITPDFVVTKDIVDDFKKFVYADTTFTKFKSASIIALDNFREIVKKERVERGDTLPGDKDKVEVEGATAALESVLRAETEKEFEKNMDYITYQLKAELLGAALGEDARTAFELKNDNQVIEANRYLADHKLFARAFKKAKDKG
ncbi:MAG: carboxyl-terminal protease [Fibrobacteres bacterium]|nr:carboxyl-terminal protease [Fibrobacterota bacterium]